MGHIATYKCNQCGNEFVSQEGGGSVNQEM